MKNAIILFIILFLFSCESKETRRDRFFLLGNEALESKEFSSAINHYSKALQIDPDHTFSLNNRGVAKIENGYPYEAIQDYNKAILIDPTYWECIENRARAYEQVGKYESSVEDLNLLEAEFPDSAKFRIDKGIVLTKMEKYNHAFEVFQAAKRLIPGDHEIEINMATVDFYRGRIDSAEMRLKKVVAEYPYSPNAFNTLNQVYLKKENYPEALKMIQKALKIEPENPYFLNNRGYTYLKMDSLDAGITDINQSILIDTDNMWAYRNKGVYYILNQEASLAIPYLEKASESAQGVEKAKYYLGMAYFESGDFQKACEIWKNDVEDESRIAFLENCN